MLNSVFVLLFILCELLITLAQEFLFIAVVFQNFNYKIELAYWFPKFLIDYEDIDVIYNSIQTSIEISEDDKQYLKERELIHQIQDLFEESWT